MIQLIYEQPIYPKNLYADRAPMDHAEYEREVIDRQINLMIERGIWKAPSNVTSSSVNRRFINSLTPKPVQKPHPPLWIGARGQKATRRAAELDAHLMTTLGPDPAPLYIETLKSLGKDPAIAGATCLAKGIEGLAEMTQTYGTGHWQRRLIAQNGQ